MRADENKTVCANPMDMLILMRTKSKLNKLKPNKSYVSFENIDYKYNWYIAFNQVILSVNLLYVYLYNICWNNCVCMCLYIICIFESIKQ